MQFYFTESRELRRNHRDPALQRSFCTRPPAIGVLRTATRLHWIRSRPIVQPCGPSSFGRIPFGFSQKAQVLRPVGRIVEPWA